MCEFVCVSDIVIVVLLNYYYCCYGYYYHIFIYYDYYYYLYYVCMNVCMYACMYVCMNDTHAIGKLDIESPSLPIHVPSTLESIASCTVIYTHRMDVYAQSIVIRNTNDAK